MKAELLNNLASTIHANAVSNGWYETKRSTNELLTLALSEFFEAFEAFRGNKYTNIVNAAPIKEELLKHKHLDTYSFKNEIKDTFEDELADTFIRALDMASYLGVKTKDLVIVGTAIRGEFTKDVQNFTMLISGLYNQQLTSDTLTILLSTVWSISKVYEFDLMDHVRLKIAYNKTRSYRHGNKIV
jgi:hypothetical protein